MLIVNSIVGKPIKRKNIIRLYFNTQKFLLPIIHCWFTILLLYRIIKRFKTEIPHLIINVIMKKIRVEINIDHELYKNIGKVRIKTESIRLIGN